MLAQACGRDDLIEFYTGRLKEWICIMVSRWEELYQWAQDRNRFWGALAQWSAQIPAPTRAFVDYWMDLAFSPPIDSLAERGEVRDLISNREFQLKRGRARLHNPRALELWSGAAGANQLNYRWRTAKTMINDIVKGLASPGLEE